MTASISLPIRLKFFFSENHWWIVSALLIATASYVVIEKLDLKVVVPVLGTLLTLSYFLQKQKLEELKTFREMFRECNSRYDKMNEKLAPIVEPSRTNPITNDEKYILIDYFNLCGEDYLYYKQGFIYPDVWIAWQNGIRQNLQNDQVKTFWLSERETNSYYGLPQFVEPVASN